jgi:hypothetical protein
MTKTLARITPTDARRFILELANLSDDPKAVMRFAHKFMHILPRMSHKLFQKELFEGSDLPAYVRHNLPWAAIGERGTPAWLSVVRAGIRNIWRAPDVRTREFTIYRFIDAAMILGTYSSSLDPVFWSQDKPVPPMPPPTPFEQIVDYLRRSVDRMAYCANSDCSAPFFFNRRSSQKFCTEDCARPSQREFKRIWWTENGKNWRKRRPAEKKKTVLVRGRSAL